MNKQIKLRAFEIVNNTVTKDLQIASLLKQKLDTSTSSNERRMLLNEGDPKREEDLISHFNTDKNNVIFATMLRIAPGNNVQHINEELFERANFSIRDLLNARLDTSAIYKNHYYFLLSNRFVVTNLPARTTITRLQTYLNWLLDELIELNPIIEIKEKYDLSNVKSFVIQDPGNDNNTNIDETAADNYNLSVVSKFKDITGLAIDRIKELFADAEDLDDVDFSQLVSAKLLIQIKQPTKNSPEDVKRAFSAILKPVSDLDNISFKTRSGTTVTGSQLQKTKQVDVDTTDSGTLNEQTLFQQMELFIKELENANKE
ncbi:hypothetical protein [Avibacterium paragallinarum]|uniref:Uncharacterized protein n=2 Tax=Avibacterium paragallinarum TaxID=728 RepID=A0ABU7QKA6_AVIPA|nr:hypothetical protein [Avibacterium paragallinarum]KAA6208113.1 hypothetical protein F1968_11125 [Avibacterium paragallinarum]QZP17058.1 hypothetical protein K5O18_07755 [Avibacterium paragallinarum]RZN68454.1 hypothetical protein EIG77_11145 [Avibacterium paragallinarum]WAL56637.1 hypothetical protein OY678_12010 [Avibacterium paragallinarum]WAM59171.1 hypothetical protein OW731_11800 [Avibacterium paragallinarum]